MNSSKMGFAPLNGPQSHSSADFQMDVTPMKTLAPVRGQTFRNQLSELAQGSRSGVLMETTMPVRYSNAKKTAMDKSTDYRVSATYTRSTHASSVDKTEWTQGWMMPSVGTEWGSVLPSDLTMKQATMTNRAIKSIMGHDVKPIDMPGISTKAAINVLMKPSVIPAKLSFVEDVTGELAAATKHTGSAVRASYLTGKLQMKNEGNTNVTGFKDYVMDNMSQLKSGGAVELARTISQERTASISGHASTTADAYAQTIAKVHNNLNVEINRRFDVKHDEYMKIRGDTNQVRKDLGDWWASSDRSHKGTALNDYGTHKYAKHGLA